MLQARAATPCGIGHGRENTPIQWAGILLPGERAWEGGGKRRKQTGEPGIKNGRWSRRIGISYRRRSWSVNEGKSSREVMGGGTRTNTIKRTGKAAVPGWKYQIEIKKTASRGSECTLIASKTGLEGVYSSKRLTPISGKKLGAGGSDSRARNSFIFLMSTSRMES